MGTYTQNDGSIVGSNYFQGLIKPWDEYICISVSDNSSVLVIGNYDGVSGSSVSFKDSTVYRVTRGSSGSYSYTTSVTEESTTTISVTEPYYIYSNTYSGAPALNCTQANSIQAYFVVFCCVLYVVNNVIGNVIRSVIKEILP